MVRYPASRSALISLFSKEEAIHLPPALDPDIFGVLSQRREKLKAWALELRDGRTEEEPRRG